MNNEYTKKKAKKPLNKRKNYDFGSYEIYEYFEFPVKEINRIKAAAYSYGSRHGKKFSVIQEDNRAYCQRIAWLATSPETWEEAIEKYAENTEEAKKRYRITRLWTSINAQESGQRRWKWG